MNRLVLATLLTILTPAVASAQQIGEQWISAGMTIAPGFVTDPTASDVGFDEVSTIGGLRARLGLHHLVSGSLSMAAEAELGRGWFDDNRLAPDGRAPSQHTFEWQLGLMGRFLPSANGRGLALGAGLHTYRAALEEAPLQVLAADLRVGWYLWKEDEFVLAEIGYALPFLAGLDLPGTFSEDAPAFVEKNWNIHRFGIGFSYGF